MSTKRYGSAEVDADLLCNCNAHRTDFTRLKYRSAVKFKALRIVSSFMVTNVEPRASIMTKGSDMSPGIAAGDLCLVVDDEPAIRRMVALVIRSIGFTTIESPDAETSLEIIRERNPALLIVDVRLPGMSGAELVKRVKSGGYEGEAPVILISAHGEPTDHEADLFMAKPFDIDDLSNAVMEVLANRS
jgi:CheY-like chemotaxis protein